MPQSVYLAPGSTAPSSLPSFPVTFPIHPSIHHISSHVSWGIHSITTHSFLPNSWYTEFLPLCALVGHLSLCFFSRFFPPPVFLILLCLPALVSFQIPFLSGFLPCVITCPTLMCYTCVLLSTLWQSMQYFNISCVCLRSLSTFWPVPLPKSDWFLLYQPLPDVVLSNNNNLDIMLLVFIVNSCFC